MEATGPLWHGLGNLRRTASHTVLAGRVVLPASHAVLAADRVTGTFASGTPAGSAPDSCEWTGGTGPTPPGNNVARNNVSGNNGPGNILPRNIGPRSVIAKDIVPEQIISRLRRNGCPKPGDHSGPLPGSRLHVQGSSSLTDGVPHDAQAEMSLR